jgi:hypothetical protein
MNVTWLSWYISGVLALAAVTTSFMTFHPDFGWWALALPVMFGAGAIVALGAAVALGRLPATHWVHESRPVRVGFAAAAVTFTLLLVLVG